MKNRTNQELRCFQTKDYFTVGKGSAHIPIEGADFHICIWKNQLFIQREQQGTGEAILINGLPCEEETYTIVEGDEVRFLHVALIFQKSCVYLKGEGISKIRVESLLEIAADKKVWEDFPRYKRSPRILKRISEETVKIQKPKELKEKKKGGLVGLILPSLVMLCVTVGVSVLMKRGLFVLMSIAGTGVTMIASIIKYVADKKEGKEDEAYRVESYENYLLKRQKEVYELYEKEQEAFRYNYPQVGEIAGMIHNYSERIYERSVNDEDFLSVSLGVAKVKCQFHMTLSSDDFNSKPDALLDEARSLIDQYSYMEQPITVDMKKAHLGLVGEKDVIHEQLKQLIAQLTFFQSYHDLEIVMIYHEKYDQEFQWMRWYRHLRIHSINVIGTISSERKRDQILGSLHQILKDRKQKEEESKKESMFLPHLMFVIDEPKLIMDHSIMEYLDKEGYNIGFSIIYTTNMRANLPENIKTIVELNDSKQATLVMEEKEEKNLGFQLSSTKEMGLEEMDLEWMARDLSVLEHMQGISAQIPESITFFGMFHVKHPQQLDVVKRWGKSNSSKSLAVPLGLRAEEDYVYLNLHEKAHGPHGLVAGTTGSGKSEIIQSYILSLAVNFHPYEVAFLLIDYKGGGMANLFSNLPHLLGTITNLDGSQSMRAMASIKSELSRRQRIFSRYDVNHINSYNKLFKNKEAESPLPHLFIISDEFAELKKEQPEFMTELVSAARIGRSLGVHLILATQKPTGVVDDQIWTNSKFKLALMVQNEADSKEILKTPDAANLTKAGRAYLQVGNNEIYELFQSAWSGAPYSVQEEEEGIDDRVYVVNDLGQGELVNEDLSEDKEDGRLSVSQLEATVNYIQDVYGQMNTVEVKRPWLPPLSEQILNPLKLQDANDTPLDLTVSLGLIDIPEEQAQEEYSVNLEKEGNLLYIASAGYGKTVFLTTAVLSIALKNDVDRVMFYILDYGNSGLIPLNKLHHVADYVTFDDIERFQKLRTILDQEVQTRKKLLAEKGVQNFEVYNQVSKEPLKAIILVMDNFDVVKELGYEAEDFFTKLTRDGYGLGIYMIATATRSNAMKYSTYNNFKNKIAGYLFDESDVNTIVGRSTYKASEIKGRALIKRNNMVSVMQIYTMTKFENEIEYNKGIESRIQEMNGYYPNKKAPRIPVLPEVFPYAAFEEYEKTQAEVYLGLEKESVTLLGINRTMSPFVILGGAATGKTNMVKTMLEQIVGMGEIYLFDSSSMELYSYKERAGVHYVEDPEGVEDFLGVLGGNIQSRSEDLQEALGKNPERNPRELAQEMPPFFVVVDDWDNFVEGTKAKAAQLTPLLLACAGVGISVILTAHAGKMKGFDEATKYAKGAVDGLLLGSPGTTGMFPVASQKELPKQKDGLLFHNGTYVRLRLPKFEL